MNKLLLFLSITFLVLHIFLHQSHAQTFGSTEKPTGFNTPMDYNFALYAKLGSFGPGLELAAHKAWYLNPRLGATYFPTLSYSRNMSTHNVDATGKVRLGTISFVNDFRYKNFFVCGGIYYNYTSYKVNVESSTSYVINDYEITIEELGKLDIEVKPKKFSVYTGLGIGHFFKGSERMTLMEAGLLFNRPYDVDMQATNMVAPTLNQKEMIEDHLNKAKMSLIITFKLFGIFRK